MSIHLIKKKNKSPKICWVKQLILVLLAPKLTVTHNDGKILKSFVPIELEYMLENLFLVRL